MELYERILKARTDRENQLKYRERKGKRKGILKGKRERDFEIAKNLKYNGVFLEMISKSTGLTMEQIRQL